MSCGNFEMIFFCSLFWLISCTFSFNDLSLEYLSMRHHDYLEKVLKIHNHSSPDIVYDNCMSYLIAYGHHSSQFVKCSIEKARPFRLCERCVVHYQRAVQVFSDIHSNDEQKDGCRELLLDADRVAVLNQVHTNILAIWSDADCRDCFSNITEDKNGTVTHTLSGPTKYFLELYTNVTDCINWHQNITIPDDKKPNETVCDICQQSYTALNSHFKELMTKTSHHVCMDLVDMMNYTRLMWGKTLQCSRHYPDDLPVILIASLLCCLPIVFYCSSWYFGGNNQKKIIKQKRMSKRLQSIYGTYEDPEVDGLISSGASRSSIRTEHT